ncbi:MAG: DUF262 domain-containing HNH endonuclease family protein [Pseudomonadota bacterium]
MAIDIKDAFQATPKSVRAFLIEPGQGCYIPAYQREYRWDKGNVDRLFEDISNGISQLVDRAKTISFLGTVIAIHDTTYATVKPINRSEMPRSVMTIIDGQQRLSTFILIFIALHNQLSRLLNQIEKQETDADEWLKNEIRKLLPELQDCFILDRRTGKGLYQYYPRLIRSFVDVWSSQPDSAQYDGAIAGMIWQYIEHINGADRTKEFRPKARGGDSGAFSNVQKVYAHITSRIKRLRKPSDDFADLLACAVEEDFGVELLGYEVDPTVVERLESTEENAIENRFRDAVASLIFAHYAQQRMAFTVVESRNEDDAFDMFEALNTTGEPLTAFETFEPRIIESEGLETYEDSEAHTQVQRVKNYLDQFIQDTTRVQKNTSDLLVSFALSDTGRKLGGKLNEQRRYLRRRFDEPGTAKSRSAFIHRLGDVADFMSTAWEVDKDTALKPLAFTDEQTTVCLDYLRRLNHTVTVAPLSRFFGRALEAGTEDGADERARSDLRGAIKACAAFTALWRGAFGTTANIDAVYRALMAEGDGTTALAAEPKDRKSIVSLPLLKSVLKAALARESIDTSARWAAKVKSTPLYRQSRPTVLFLTSAAAKDAVADNADPGLSKLGRTGVNDTFSTTAWQQFVEMEVEHVAPQSGSSGTWDQQIYDDGDLVHTLGNLTLLRKEQNIVMSDHSWAKKRLGFKALSAKTHEAFEAVRGEAKQNGLSLPATGEAVLASSAYAPLLVPIAEKTTDWDAGFVEQRSVRLAELAWDQLYAWLQ